MRRYDDTYKSLFYVSLGTGCGGALTFNNNLWYGLGYKAGEFGSLLFPRTLPDDPSFPFPGSYKKLENLVNLDAVFNRFHVNLQNSSDIPETLREEIIRYLCPYLAYSIANMVHLLDIQHCVLAGIIPMALGYPLIEHLQKSLDRLLPYDYIKVEAPCSNNTGIIGGAVTVFNRQLETLFQESP